MMLEAVIFPLNEATHCCEKRKNRIRSGGPLILPFDDPTEPNLEVGCAIGKHTTDFFSIGKHYWQNI